MKKLITLLLVVMLAFSSFAACGDKKNSGSSDKGDSSSAPVVDNSSSSGGGIPDDMPEKLPFNYAIDAEGNITFDTTPIAIGSAPAEGASYTYRAASASLPTAWNSHTYQSNDATTVTGYTTDSLFTFDYNETLDGYRIIPAMATDYPTDVTSQFVGKWGIDADSANRVYKIDLRSDLKFDNGDPITAETFVESMKLLLNPEAANYRADSYFSGNLIIANAKNYSLQGSYAYSNMISENYGDEEYVQAGGFSVDADGNYYTEAGHVEYNINDGGSWSTNSLGAYAGAGYLSEYVTDAEGNKVQEVDEEGNPVVDEEGNPVYATQYIAAFQTLLDGWRAGKNADGYVRMNETLVAALADCVAVLHGHANAESYAEEAGDYAYLEWQEFCYYGKTVDSCDWSEVGFFAEGNSLYVVNEKELSGFYLLYSLATDFFLVHPETYKKCITTEAGVYTNSYGTSVETYVGFGPYRLSSYLSSNHVHFEKNPYWYGYALEENANYYWTTKIEISQVADEATRLNMFLAGDLDTYGLQAADMDEYQGSEHTYFTEGDSTWFVALNPDLEGLEAAQAITDPTVAGREVNKTILTVKEFRQALSFSIDRAAYALALDPLGGTAKAIFGNMIISDPLTGTAYRTTEEAKDVILKFWGLDEEVGPAEEGYLYATKDEAIASITGYDLAGARKLFDEAYDIAIAQGLIKNPDNFEIAIMIGQPGSGSSAYYNNGYELLKQVWTEAVVGTKLEGKLVFEQSQPLGSTSFSDYLKSNEVDVLFGVGWTGSALDPFGLMEAYVAPNYQYDPGWDTAATMLDVDLTDLDGRSYTLRASVYDWGKLALNGGEIRANVVVDGEVTKDYVELDAGTGCDASIRLAILAAVEGAVLQQYDMIPINLDSSANLKGMKIKYGTEEYVFGVGRGGIKYMTYNYSDAEWAAFVAENAVDGQLNYK